MAFARLLFMDLWYCNMNAYEGTQVIEIEKLCSCSIVIAV